MSVILPVRNAADTVKVQLEALATQTYRGAWELVVGDNGSTDGSIERLRAHAPKSSATVVSSGHRASRPTTRNIAVRASRGSILAFCDADDRVSPDWLAELVDAFGEADLVAGQRVLLVDGDLSASALAGDRVPLYDFLPFADTCNMAVRRSVFDAVGGFDTRYTLSSDVEFSWRVQLAGYRFRFARHAVVGKRFVTGRGPSRTQRFGWGRVQPRLYRQYCSAGMPRPALGSVLEAWTKLMIGVPLLASRWRKLGWGGELAMRVGRLVGSLENHVLYL